jgi:hypothetical protein
MSLRRKTETFEPVTMGHIRSHGCRDLQLGECHHSATIAKYNASGCWCGSAASTQQF